MKTVSRRRAFGSNSKGQGVIDLLFLVIFLIVFGIIAVVLSFLYRETNSMISDDDTFSNETKEIMQTGADTIPSVWDYGFLFAVVFLWIGMIASSFYINTNPAFFVVSFILLFFVLYVGGTMANVWGEVTDDGELMAVSAASDFPITNWVFNNFIVVLLVIGGTTLWALFGRPQ